MRPSFSTEEFLQLLSDYNTATWIPQVLLCLLAIGAVASAFTRRGSARAVFLVLALLWIWVGVVFHLLFFWKIAERAWLFSGLSIIQATIFLREGLAATRRPFRTPRAVPMALGAVFMVYALALYPIIGAVIGHVYPRSQVLGAPCPTTLLTLGMLLWMPGPPRWGVFAIPVLWSLGASVFAIRAGVYEDIGLLLGGLGTVLILLLRRRRGADRCTG